LLLFVGYELIGTSIITNHHQSALAQIFNQDVIDRPSVKPTATAVLKPYKPPGYTGPAIIGRLTIPKLGQGWSRIIVQGVSLYALAYGPGHYPQTVLPGVEGTTALACHRTGWGSPCINLDRVHPGDFIYIDTKLGRYTYKVTATKQVEAKDGWVLAGDPNSQDPYRLTLTTCTPKYTSLHRLIIWADQILPLPGQPPPPVPK
jgi:sortase A